MEFKKNIKTILKKAHFEVGDEVAWKELSYGRYTFFVKYNDNGQYQFALGINENEEIIAENEWSRTFYTIFSFMEGIDTDDCYLNMEISELYNELCDIVEEEH